jgi:hypothetical protein
MAAPPETTVEGRPVVSLTLAVSHALSGGAADAPATCAATTS